MAKKKYDMELYKPSKKKSDCDIILDDVENVFGSIGNCLDTVLDERKSKMQVVGGVFGIGKSLLKFGWHGTTCVVKNTPKAIATVANTKRELTDTVTNEYQKYQKEIKEDALNDKIAKLKQKTTVH